MWLLNSKTYKLEAFFDASIPKFAVLSHTWGEEEVTFQDIQYGGAGVQQKRGYAKIQYTCRQARKDGLPYVWIDTCCIDKSSSAELSEAINSMYRWYESAEVCYAYLQDVPGDCPVLNDISAYERFDASTESCWNSTFAESRWFTRGWTLQELVAPKNLRFYSCGWNKVGTKRELLHLISRITRIDYEVLGRSRPLSSVSIAKRMSWAAERETSRVEDQAYSLLGIFELNMPMLYGEGKGAFVRLQEEIIKTSTDHSIFVWKPLNDDILGRRLLFAPSPKNFSDGNRVIPLHQPERDEPYEMTNKGLRVSLPILPEPDSLWDSYLGILNCRYEDDFSGPIALRLSHSQVSQNGIDEFEIYGFSGGGARVCVAKKEYVASAKVRSLFIRRKLIPRTAPYSNRNFLLRVEADRHGYPKCFVKSAFPDHCWNLDTLVVTLPPMGASRNAAILRVGNWATCTIAFGCDEDFWEEMVPWVGAFKTSEYMTLEAVCKGEFLKSRFAKLMINPDLQVMVSIKNEEIMGEGVFVVEVSFVQPQGSSLMVSSMDPAQLGFGRANTLP